jgi:hypothetical protein
MTNMETPIDPAQAAFRSSIRAPKVASRRRDISAPHFPPATETNQGAWRP